MRWSVLILARHGRTEHNAQGRLLGRLDPSLDELGRSQAAALAEAVVADAARRGARVSAVVTSPLRRTAETAAAVAAVAGVEVVADERWIELDYGDFDGRPLADVPPDVWRAWRADPAFAPPGGESLADLRLRVEAALSSLGRDGGALDPHDDDVVVVSHVSPIKAAVAWCLGVPDEVTWRLHLAPASVCRLTLAPHGPVLHTFNELAHLA
ncbi:MAG: histidine phosphatase family protein [Acidimicrobiales bacterium]